MEITLATDSDGFLSQQCPSCDQRFKVLFGAGSEQPISYCPYCRYRGERCWHTAEQVAYAQSVAVDLVLRPELSRFERELKRRSDGFLKIEAKSSVPDPLAAPIEADEALDLLRFQCCNETIKVWRQDRHFCIICGDEVEMTMSDSKGVFLSHRGVDKQMVIDFKETLTALGFAPWLDDDAMPAGTPLERGLLEGMQKSCAVVFFITPSFEDKGYLETEINYAIQEKWQKGDKFAIITLQFVDEHGKVAEIPPLLRPYVWKKPKSTLAAVREIVRALPVVPGTVDWRDEISGVARIPALKPASAELSEEAKAILKAAVASGGRVTHTCYIGGEHIFAGNADLLPDHDSRTVAQWVGGLEDLQRRRYIKDCGHKGEMFEVTREGYAAADTF